MHTRSVVFPPRASRSALHLALLLAGLLSQAAPATARGSYPSFLAPSDLLRYRPRTAAEAAASLGLSPRRAARALPLAAPPSEALPTESGTWTALGDPGVRFQHESVFDPVRGRVVVFGGWGDPLAQSAPALVMASDPGSTTDWQALGADSPEVPAARFAPAAAFDPAHDALVVFGGQATDGSGATFGDLWSLSLAPGGTWTRLAPSGPAPAPRRFASLFWDAAHARFVLAGGHDAQFFDEFWELTLEPDPAWRPLVFDNSVGASLGAVLDDPVHGDAWCVAWQAEIHHLTLGADTVTAGPALAVPAPLGPWGTPSLQLAGYDPATRRLLWFGWQGDGPTYARLGEATWFAPGEPEAVAPLAIESPAPANRGLFATAWDPASRRLFVTGGYDDDRTWFGDAWQLTAAPALSPVAGAPPAGSGGVTLAPLANPSRDLALRLTLRAGVPARLRVLDAAGRRIADAELPAGTNAWRLDRAAAPGVYFAELVQGGERRTVKLVATN